MSTLLYKIEKTYDDTIKTVLTNIIKMVTNRGHLDKKDLDKNISQLTSKISDDMIYSIKLNNNKKLAIIVMPYKITAINKSFGAIDFLNKFANDMKIVVVKEMAKKVKQYINTNYTDAEIFDEDELMINLVDHFFVPEHILLSKEVGRKVMAAYNCKKTDMPKIYNTDPVARYYGMQIGDICKIVRPSEKSGYAIYYRRVVKGDVNK